MKCQCCGYEWFKTTINEIHGLCPVCLKKGNSIKKTKLQILKDLGLLGAIKDDEYNQEIPMDNKDLTKARYFMFIACSITLLFAILCALLMHSCTISFNNVSTAGKAQDIIDEEQKTDPNISPDISIPITGV